MNTSRLQRLKGGILGILDDAVARLKDAVGTTYLLIEKSTGVSVGGWSSLGSIFSGWDIKTDGVSGPNDRVIFDFFNKRGSSSTGGRFEEGASRFHDEFHARTFRGEWAIRVETGAYGVPNTDLNGWVRFTTGAVATNEQSKDFGGVYGYTSETRPTLQVELLLPVVDNDINIFIGLVDANVVALYDGNVGSLIGFLMSHSATGDTNWHLQASHEGGGSRDAGDAADTSRHVLRFEYYSDTEVQWFIDNVSQGVVDTNVPSGKDMQPCISVITDVVAAKSLDIGDYRLWQDVQ